jgi:oligopeptidase A
MRLSAISLLCMRILVSASALLLKSKLLTRSTHLRMASTIIDPLTKGSHDDSNPLIISLDKLPQFGKIKPIHVKEAVEKNLAKMKEEFAAFEGVLKNPQSGESWGTRRIEYDFTGVVEKLETIQAPLSSTWGTVGHLMGVQNSEDLRKVHDEMMPAVIDSNQAMGQSQPLFMALTALKKRQSVWSRLTETQRRIVDSSLRQMEASGVGLPDDKREVFNKLQLQAAELGTKFSNNVLDSTKAFKLKIVNEADIDGLPATIRAMTAANAVADGDAGATAEKGPW